MFSIIISEKGGAERRESFDKNEINVGRVQGNDLMLPKGNVSKHHARLLFRDGRFIVTDLKSTNGTYVNGRKIAQATIVREGDKIYIGDFVLRLETNGASASAEAASSDDDDAETAARENDARPRAPAPAPPMPPKPMTQPPGAVAARPMPPNGPPALPPQGGPPPLGGAGGTMSSATGHRPPDAAAPPGFPPALDDNDDSAEMPKPRLSAGTPAAPPMGGPRPMTMPLNPMPPPGMGHRPPVGMPGGAAAPAPPPPPPAPPGPMGPMGPMGAGAGAGAVQAPPAVPVAPVLPAMAPGRPSAPPPRVPPKETPAQAGRRLALMTLLDRIADSVDLGPLRTPGQLPDGFAQQVERAAREQANAMREEGDAPEGIDLDAVARDAHRELVGLGAFGPLLDDEEVAEINCVRFDQVFTVRSSGIAAEPTAFSSEESLRRIIERLAFQSGDPWKPGESVIERRLARASFVAVAPPASAGHVVSIRKRRRIEASLDELTRAGALSRSMAQFLDACAAARANILVSGNAPLAVLSALASAGSGGERVVVVQDVEELGVGSHTHAVILSIADTRQLGEECVRAAAKLRPERLVVTQLAGGVAAGTMDAMAEGADGVLAGLSAPTLRQGLSRLVAQLVLHRPGLAIDGVRDVVGEAFDIAVEVGAMADGRLRVMRIAELGGSDAKGIVARDIFVFNADPASGDGAYSATGVVPRMATDLAARGMKLDPAIFKRAGR